MKLIYVGAHDEVTMPAVPGVLFHREGEPNDVPDDLAEGLVARGDFIEFQPEPAPRPVQKHNPPKE